MLNWDEYNSEESTITTASPMPPVTETKPTVNEIAPSGPVTNSRVPAGPARAIHGRTKSFPVDE